MSSIKAWWKEQAEIGTRIVWVTFVLVVLGIAGISLTVLLPDSGIEILKKFPSTAYDGLKDIAVLGPLATFIVALVAWRTYKQKTAADKKDQWWRRAEWSIGLALKEDPESRLAGLTAITELSRSSQAATEDSVLFTAVTIAVRDEVLKKLVENNGSTIEIKNVDGSENKQDDSNESGDRSA